MRNRVIILIAAVLMTGCAKNVIDPQSPISFAPVAEKATRSIIEGTTYPTSETFTVSAFFEGTAPYFENLEASYNSTVTFWETSTTEYWPLEGSLTFNAYSPSDAGLTIDETGVSVTGYTVKTTDEMTTDLCYASATVADCSAHPDAVPLTFSHALSQIVFRVKAAAYYENVTLSLNSLSMGGINSVGDFNGTAWENQNTEYSYTLASTPTVLTYDGENNPETTDVCSYLFLPQELGANAAINVGYSISQVVSGTNYSLVNPPVPISLGGGTVTRWEPGKKYIYTLSIGLSNVITISASAVGWSDENFEIIVEDN